ncbi:MAG: carbamate kinase [Candidatus Marinimicrobia bacterium]|nr:carbamate kinase [Candidatus Neomarinimicrobiota bacterium]
MSRSDSKRIVIAFGGNAIVSTGQRGTVAEQFANVRKSLLSIAKILKIGYDVIITHGNGPQVGDALLRAEMASDVVPVNPLGVCVAETEGTMGYMIQQTLMNVLHTAKIKRPVVTLLSQLLVDPNDKAFDNPSKPIGPEYAEWEAVKLQHERGWKLKKNSHGKYRRVVASPVPLELLEADVLKLLVENGSVVIAAGGGGIPVCKDKNGIIDGVDAVIDKDLASALLGEVVGASHLILATAVDGAYLNFNTQGQELLKELKVNDAHRFLEVGHFPAGSMGPKIQAAINFCENGGDKAIICSVDEIVNALEGKSGTTLTL